MAEVRRASRPAVDLLFAVAGVVLLVFLVGPLLALLLSAPGEVVRAAIADRELHSAVAVSVGCALLAVLLGVLLGTPLGYLLERRRIPFRGLVQALLSLPLVVPHPVVGIALLLLLSRGRLLGALLEGRLGIAVAGAWPGIVLAMLFVSAPLIVRGAQEGFRFAGERYEQVAESLGASRFGAFRLVALPLARPAILAGALSAFARAVSEFGSIVVLAYFPRSAPVLIWDRFTSFGLDAAVPATGFLLLVTLAILWIWTRVERRWRALAGR